MRVEATFVQNHSVVTLVTIVICCGISVFTR